MIFWILLTAAIIAIVWLFVLTVVSPLVEHREQMKTFEDALNKWEQREAELRAKHGSKYESPWYTRPSKPYAAYTEWGVFVAGTIITSVVFGVLLLLTFVISFEFQTGNSVVAEKDTSLTAVATREQTEGRVSGGIFLTSGYVKSEPVFSYISEENGAYRAKWAPADESVVYQDGNDDPHVIYRKYDWYASWFLPWSIGSTETYEFHVPEGSVEAGYSVEP